MSFLAKGEDKVKNLLKYMNIFKVWFLMATIYKFLEEEII
jgi:hypothetical protein